MNSLSHAAFFPLCHRRMVTQLYTWQPVSMVTPTRRRSCSCCCAEELIPVSATWRTTSRLTCCRAACRESRWAAHHCFTAAVSVFYQRPFIFIFIYVSISSSSSCWRNEVLPLVGVSCPYRTRNDVKKKSPLVIPIWREWVFKMFPLLRRGFTLYCDALGVSGLYIVNKLVWHINLQI